MNATAKAIDPREDYQAEDQYQHWTRKLRSTCGVMCLARDNGAYWLIDAIASYQGAKLDEACDGFQVWLLQVDTTAKSAVLRCFRDIGNGGPDASPHAVRQEIEYSDFPLREQKFYVGGAGNDRVLMLPEEY